MMKGKKAYYIICMLLTVMLIAASFSGCKKDGGSGANGGSGGTESALSGSSADVLQQVLDDATAALGDGIPATFVDPVTAENSPAMIGVLSDDFVSFVEEATSASAMINTFAFRAAVIKCKSAGDASMVLELIMDGFDSGQWVCVFPEQSMAMVSGAYVLLAVGTVAQVTELGDAFRAQAGGVAFAPNIFYEGEIGGGAADGEGGMAIAGGPAPLDLE